MSRTDAHAPYWVRAEWYEPLHDHCQFDMRPYRSSRWRECDLPERAVRHNRIPVRRPRYEDQVACTWEPVWPGSWRMYRWMRLPHVPKWFVDHRWNNPERVRMRDECLDMIKEYRGCGSVQAETLSGNHKHGGRWDWD